MGAVAGEELMKLDKMQGINAREEKILVLVRLRPLNEKEIMANEVADWECINDTSILYRNTLREGSTFPSAYTFDRVFRGECSTKQVYEQGAREIAFSVVSGINSSIFAYGQTSSGKTYTMDGIIEYSVADIFDYIRKHEERAFVVKFSAIEIYNEAVRDLLSTDSTPLRLLDDHERGTIVEKVTEETLRDWNHLKELLSVCEAQRRIGETSLNEKSSRSHQIIKLTIESSAREFLGKDNSTTLAASVNFIDLAGSERAAQALSAGARLKEGCHINRSLLTLGTVIRKLSKGRNGHINYRDSKLTRILQPCLGGNARTAIVCTLSPARSHVEQTRNTLLFACCAKEVTTKAQVNVVMSDKALVKHLQKELARLESELRTPAPVSSSSDYAALLKKKDLQIEKLAKENRELTKQRDLAHSRIEDLLRMVGHDDASGKVIKSSHFKLQARDALEDEGSGSETSSVIDSRGTDMGGISFNNHYSDGESDDGKRFLDSHSGHSGMTTAVTDSRGMDMGGKSSNSHYYDGKRFLDSHSGRSGMTTAVTDSRGMDMGGKSSKNHYYDGKRFLDSHSGQSGLTTAVTDSRGMDMGGKSFNNHYYDGKRFLDSHLGRSGMTTAVAIEEESDDCKEVQCIEMEESIRDDGLLLHAPNNGGFRGTPQSGLNYGNMVGHEMISTAVNGNGEVRQIQNNSANDQVEQGLHDVRRTAITSISSPYCHDANPQVAADMSRSRSWRRRENLMTELPPDEAETTPPHGFEKSFPGRPEGFERKLPQLDFDGRLLRLDSQSSIGSARSTKTSADDDITRLDTFVAGLKKMTNSEYGKELADGQVLEDGQETDFLRNIKGARGQTGQDALVSSDWSQEFQRQQRTIIELWQTCNVSIVHRTYFFMLFKGDPADSIYMEVELRRLSFLKQTFYYGNEAIEDGRKLTFASSVRNLRRERKTLSKLMQKRLSEEERTRLFQTWGIALKSKRRRLQLINRLWSDPKSMNHVQESAAIVAKLVKFAEQGQSLKGNFGLSFITTPPQKSRSFSWKNTRTSLL
ncbi:kinesin-like protein KIN-7E isoform X1 [Cucurbita moschata]|uniref:Kinesin-like protein KIN-7E isoform X1 n=1 Tax=Cucurbita moschata TaxID=3662 RepID=A0A6J1ET71_CUCMO|nr:kinesin-like protein KIN-7E isoform X1 [Cucurbita moschata]XP_022931227.1 kinesin-like protein KIN-7E isoform X1 [Cucurbita moschata]XP_022931235.1 kinesin-like protein KIN-7E isoform X1 [Cucurbita moschata]XP_022931243.1 kinesin-like protein KIN-7E isoform X1 [Cucurbita moschata]XP_022931252.1 kinesin-like protein KIN-7E isoform X1 [Cucurbita moschata]XP_022931261.1 kinesin-like protein KIN-7E isoform X1 [Cucurbita moschata]XP_022931265.1 kinesin-like protein KIN-7E isoform X1 [Cucurbita 